MDFADNTAQVGFVIHEVDRFNFFYHPKKKRNPIYEVNICNILVQSMYVFITHKYN